MVSETRSLHGYFRSSAAYRVRIALNLKGLGYQHIGVHLLRDGGEQLTPAFRQINPQAQVPVLHEDGFSLTQSLAIMEYLDERYPEAPLLPRSLEQRARARQFALTVACDIHPLNNPRVLKFLVGHYGVQEDGKLEWIRHWIDAGFEALETLLQAEEKQQQGAAGGSRFCVGDSPTIADCCLIPQVFNAVRFGVEVARFPRVGEIAATCNALPAFQRASPAQQPDAE